MGDLIDWLLFKGDSENDRVVIESKDMEFETNLSGLLQQNNSRVMLKCDLLKLAWVER